ncbi:MAG: hypothetical protein ABW164_03960 [Sphingobium sp.]
MNQIEQNFATLRQRIACLPDATPPAPPPPLATLIARVDLAKRAYQVRPAWTAAR